MNHMSHFVLSDADGLWQAADRAARAVPPAWPLDATVAVNPFLGQADRTLAEAAAETSRLSGVSLFPNREGQLARITRGEVTRVDLATALARHPEAGFADPDALLQAARRPELAPAPIPDIVALATIETGIDWRRLVADRIGLFASGYVDLGQALWPAARQAGLFSAWRTYALHDLTPEIAGLSGFAAHVATLPGTARDLVAAVGADLGLGSDPGSYFDRLLLDLGGLAQHARYRQFVAERDGGADDTILDLLAVRLAFESGLFRLHRDAIGERWAAALARYRAPAGISVDLRIDAILQDAAERAEMRRLAGKLRALPDIETSGRPQAAALKAQAVFCIDVRSEIFRRALETVDPAIRTLGFAGFFGVGAAHRAAASDLVEHRLPVLLPAGTFSCEAVAAPADVERRLTGRAKRAYARFKQAAVSSFAFVEATGLTYLGNILRDTFGMAASRKRPAVPALPPGLATQEQARIAGGALRAMSLTTDFAPVVLIVGHGATSANNPFLSALQCGACGGHAGDVNARLLARMLNDPDVRVGLNEAGIAVPAETLFVAGLHDTTTDTVTLFDADCDVTRQREALSDLARQLALAGQLAAAERAVRLPRGEADALANRSRDWSEVRPEWGLAGCSAFLAGPRDLSAGVELGGRVFLHEYHWRKDEGFKILELILTAPVVVASWISLQYYGSAVAPSLYGAGNKLLHNVVSGVGVIEGNGGLMRAGLPWQSVHDGDRLMHDPLRLTVFVAAPEDALTAVLARHADLRALFDNGWLRLVQIEDGTGRMREYVGKLEWTAMAADPAAASGRDLPRQPVADPVGVELGLAGA
jgi:hypothetical protein